jgi:molybdenum cofactor synthesis domain-containing protein
MKSAAVLTISDSVSAGTREDRSGPAVCDRLKSAGWDVPRLEVLPDDKERIAGRLKELARSGQLNAIFTTGGTGCSLRDVTPEATRTVIDREIPGLGEIMRSRGMAKTPLAALSRATAGTLGDVLIVNLPGSPKGAVESFDAIVELLPHIVDLLTGNTEHPERESNSWRR